jgi:hypothetical protein
VTGVTFARFISTRVIVSRNLQALATSRNALGYTQSVARLFCYDHCSLHLCHCPPGLAFSATLLIHAAQVFILVFIQFHQRLLEHMTSDLFIQASGQASGHWYSSDRNAVSPSVCVSAFVVRGYCAFMCSRFLAITRCHQYVKLPSFSGNPRRCEQVYSTSTLGRSILS